MTQDHAWQPEAERLYLAYKPYLTAVAYRLLGAVSDAEDAVQDVFLSLRRQPAEPVRDYKAYLGRMVVNHCLNLLKSAKRKREAYFGEWLPEPLVASAEHDPERSAELADTVSYAFLLLLDRLAPVERAVYVLREAFGFGYDDIAGMLDKTEVNCRKIYSRALRKIESCEPAGRARFPSGREEKLVRRFVAAFRTGAIPDLMKLLTEDAVFVSDGGGKVRAAVKPIFTRQRVAVILSVLAANKLRDAEARIANVNGGTGLLYVKDGTVLSAFAFDWDARTEELRRIYTVLNPDKLAHLQPPD